MRYAALIVDNRPENILPAIQRHKPFLPESWEILVHSDVEINSLSDYNTYMTKWDLWLHLSVQFERVLIFQHDSGLLREGIEDFLEWDYVGAPWKFMREGGNGGLSLRNPKSMLGALRDEPFNEGKYGNEDVFFSRRMMCEANTSTGNARLAPRSVCSEFSVETIFQMDTLGYHAIDKHLTQDECEQIMTQYAYI